MSSEIRFDKRIEEADLCIFKATNVFNILMNGYNRTDSELLLDVVVDYLNKALDNIKQYSDNPDGNDLGVEDLYKVIRYSKKDPKEVYNFLNELR